MLNNGLVEKSLIQKGQISSLSGNKPFIFSVLKKAALVCALTGIVMGVASDNSYAASKEKVVPVAQTMCKDFSGVDSVQEMLVGVGAYAKIGQTVKYETDSCHLEITPVYSKGGFKINYTDAENTPEEEFRAYAIKSANEYKLAISLEKKSKNKIPGTNINTVDVDIVNISSDEIAFDENINSRDTFNIGGYQLSSHHFNISNIVFGNMNLPEEEQFDENRADRDGMEIVQGIVKGFTKHTGIPVVTVHTPAEKQSIERMHAEIAEISKGKSEVYSKKESLFTKIFDAVFEKEEKSENKI